MELQSLDFTESEARAGFRLHAMEIYNWGTFHDRVWHIEPGGDNACSPATSAPASPPWWTP